MTGIVMMGGLSTRMGVDKAELQWFGKPMYVHCYQLLQNFCTNVYLSVRYGQAMVKESSLPVIEDISPNEGPMTGVISSYRKTNDTLLFLPVDMPLIGKAEIQFLVESHHKKRGCTAFYHSQAHVYEPLFSIWEPEMLASLDVNYTAGDRSLQGFMRKSGIEKLTFPFASKLESANTPDEWQSLVNQAKGQEA